MRVFAVSEDGRTLSGGKVFCEIENGVPDGFRIDNEGWMWCSSADGVDVFDTDGTLCGRIRVPQRAANLTFGGPRRNRLFITATTSLYAIYVNARGAQTP
ncbi:SMP-30/Gluconolaconase/LRE-like region [compost metagenome]